MKTIVCLVSHQPMANAIPVLELAPDKVILLQTKQEKAVAMNLSRLFSAKKIKTEIYDKFLDPYDLDTVKSACRVIINETGNDTILNVTGGTKPMAIAAYEIFKSSDRKVIYYDPAHNEIIHLNPTGIPDVSVKVKIGISEYLKAHGYDIFSELTHSGRAEGKRKFISALNYHRLNEFLNFYAECRSSVSLDIPKKVYNRHRFVFAKNYDNISITDEIARNKVKSNKSAFNFGDWLEDILFLKLKEKDYDDIKYSVKIVKDGVKSEIDVVAVKDCRLFLYSCKDKKKTDKFDLFEIEVLRNVAGGTFGNAGIVITKEDDYLKLVARNLNINVFNIREFFK